MDIGLGLAFATATLWAFVAAGYAAAARRQLTMIPFVAVSASFGALLSLFFLTNWEALPAWRAAVPVALWIAFSGATGQAGMVLIGAAMAVAPRQSAATWTLSQMAMVAPFLVANLSGREQAVWYKWSALPFILLTLRGLTPRYESREDAPADYRVWLGLVSIGILFAGAAQIFAQEISLRGLRDGLNLRTTVTLGVGGAALWFISLFRRQYPTRDHLFIGCLTGLVVAAGNVTLFAALDYCAAAGRAYLVFPMAVGGSVLLFALYQVLKGHERCNVRKIAGLVFGLSAIALLGLP